MHSVSFWRWLARFSIRAGDREGVACRLGRLCKESNPRAETREIVRLQEIRRELKGHARLAAHSIFEDFAFHYGYDLQDWTHPTDAAN
jgi:hypothetical protein